jgi:hypothetical protein
MTISYQKNFTTLSNDDDENAFTNEGEELIRSRVEAQISARILQDTEQAMVFKNLEMDERKRLLSETGKRLLTGRTKKRMW